MTRAAQYVDARSGPTLTLPHDLVKALASEQLVKVCDAVFAAYDAKLIELGFPEFASTRGRPVKEV